MIQNYFCYFTKKKAALHAEFNGRREELEKTGELEKLLDEAQSLRDQAPSYHHRVINFAEMAQECHDQMISNLKRLIRLGSKLTLLKGSS